MCFQEWRSIGLRLDRDTDYMKHQLLDAFKTTGNMTMNKTVLERVMQLEDTFQQDSQFSFASHLKLCTTHKRFIKIL